MSDPHGPSDRLAAKMLGQAPPDEQDRLAQIEARREAFLGWLPGTGVLIDAGDVPAPVREFIEHVGTDVDWLVEQLKQWRQAAGAEANLADERGREIARLRDLTARLEWAETLPGAGPWHVCPVCSNHRDRGHDPDCWLAAALAVNDEDAPPPK